MSRIRVTTLGTADSMLNYIRNGESRYLELSKESSSQLKVTKPSDDASATKSLLNIKAQMSQLNNYLNNMSLGENELSVLDDSLTSLTALIDSATDYTTQAASGTYSHSNMDNIRVQIDNIIQSVVDVANTNYNGTYIFSGTASLTKPYTTTTDASGNILSVTYNGTLSTHDYKRYLTISDGVSVAVNTTGDQVFGSYRPYSDNGTPLVPGDDIPEDARGVVGTLMKIRNALGNYDQTAVGQGLDGLKTALDTVSVIRTKFASISNRFQITRDSIDTTLTQLKAYKSDLQDADLPKVLSDLAAQQTALQATYSVTTKLLNGVSILDYM